MRMGIGLGVGINRSNYAQGIFGAYQSRVVADGGTTEAGGCVDAGATTLLQTASLLLIPSGYKANKLYSEIPTSDAGDSTWTRASNGTRTNSSGTIETMGNNVPRLDYSFSSCPGVLVEGQRTNLVLYSAQFDDATWTKSSVSITANSVTSPDGTTNADTFESTTNTTTEVIVSQNISSTSGTNYAFTFYVKPNNQNFVFLCINGQGTTQNFITAVFDLSDGTVGQTAVGTTSGTIVSTSIQQASNGFYRLTLVGSINFTNLRARIGLATAKTGNSISTTGSVNIANSLGKSVYIYGSQLEAGTFPSTYIATTTASATRLSDTNVISGVSSLIGQTQGVVFFDMYYNLVTNGGFRMFASLEGTILNAFSGITIGTTNNGNNIQFGSNVYSFPSTGRYKIACLYNSTTNTSKLFVNGVLRSTSTFAGFVNTVSQICIGARINTFSGFAQDRQGFLPFYNFAIFPTALTDAECVAITT